MGAGVSLVLLDRRLVNAEQQEGTQQVSAGTRVSHTALLWQRGSGQKHPALPQGPLRSTWHVSL